MATGERWATSSKSRVTVVGGGGGGCGSVPESDRPVAGSEALALNLADGGVVITVSAAGRRGGNWRRG
uniref:Uncharacterized protein n=1 Tax=Oryza barthii TaxID=65489 RepID=A0A0D3G768_9ORYZ